MVMKEICKSLLSPRKSLLNHASFHLSPGPGGKRKKTGYLHPQGSIPYQQNPHLGKILPHNSPFKKGFPPNSPFVKGGKRGI